MMHLFARASRAAKLSDVHYSRVRRSDESPSKEGLLQDEQDYVLEARPFWTRYRSLILAHVVLLGLYLTSTIYLVRELHLRTLHGPRLVDSPAWDAVHLRQQTFTLGDRIQEHSRFSGKPSPEVDRAWHDLLNDENIRIEPEIMKRLGREDIGVRVPGEDAYIGTLNVYHEIHCLKRIHQYMYQDTYFPGIDDKQREMNRLHNEHCIDFLRQSAMCHGDVGLITFEWSPSNRIPVANATTHQCVDWNRLDKWTKQRSLDMLKPGWLVHPTLGLAYPQGEGDNIGAAASP